MSPLEEIRREVREKFERLKSDSNLPVYAPWRNRRCGIAEEHRGILKRGLELQNRYLERLPKKLQGTYQPAIEIGLAMENAVDVARELSKYPYSHIPYIEEKIRFLENKSAELAEMGCL